MFSTWVMRQHDELQQNLFLHYMQAPTWWHWKSNPALGELFFFFLRSVGIPSNWATDLQYLHTANWPESWPVENCSRTERHTDKSQEGFKTFKKHKPLCLYLGPRQKKTTGDAGDLLCEMSPVVKFNWVWWVTQHYSDPRGAGLYSHSKSPSRFWLSQKKNISTPQT